MQQAPNRQELQRYNVTRPGWEAIRQTLYDYQAYAAAGQVQLLFFQVPKGQSSKTASDTNMSLAGQLPAGQEYLAQSIECPFWPTVPTVAAQNPAATLGAQVTPAMINDVALFCRTGFLSFDVLSKNYLSEGPLGRFPAKTYLDVFSAMTDTTTAGAAQNIRVAYAKSMGRPYQLTPTPVKLTSSQNFSVSMNWPEGVQAITNAARTGVILDGILYRQSQ